MSEKWNLETQNAVTNKIYAVDPKADVEVKACGCTIIKYTEQGLKFTARYWCTAHAQALNEGKPVVEVS